MSINETPDFSQGKKPLPSFSDRNGMMLFIRQNSSFYQFAPLVGYSDEQLQELCVKIQKGEVK